MSENQEEMKETQGRGDAETQGEERPIPRALHNEIGYLPGDCTDGMNDTLGCLICDYFEDHPSCPDDDVDDETGRSEWAIRQTDLLVDVIARFVLDYCDKELAKTGSPESATMSMGADGE